MAKKLLKIFKKPDSEDRSTQTAPIQIVTGTQSLRDILTLMKRSKYFFKLVEKTDGDVFWNGLHEKPLGGSKISIMDEEYDITPNFQVNFTKSYRNTKPMKIEGKSTV